MKINSPRHPSALLGAAAATLMLGLSACGSEEPADAGAGPASLVPPDAALYVDSVVRPDGEAKETIERLFAAGGEPDIGQSIVDELNSSAEEEGAGLSYAEDVEPWLGERAGLFFGDAESLVASGGEFEAGATAETIDPGCLPPEPPDDLPGTAVPPVDETCGELSDPSEDGSTDASDVAVLVETTDEDAAQAALEKVAEQLASDGDAEISEETYEGVDYLLVDGAEDESTAAAVGIVDGYAVAGDRDGFGAVVDAAAGDSLADAAEFTDGIADLSEAPFASFYADVPAIVEAAQASGELDATQEESLSFYGEAVSEPAFGALTIDDEAIDLAYSNGSVGFETADAELLGALPADSFAALGIPAVGEYVGQLLDQFRSDPELGPGLRVAEKRFQQELGLPLTETLTSIGDVSGFVRGESLLAIDGAVVAEFLPGEITPVQLLDALADSAERDGARLAEVDGLDGAVDARGFEIEVDGAPQPVYVVVLEQTLAIAYGERAATDAVAPRADEVVTGAEPRPSLRDDETYVAAVEALDGAAPNLYVDAEPIEALITSSPVANEQSEKAGGVIGEFDYLISGAKTENGRDTTRYRLGLDAD